MRWFALAAVSVKTVFMGGACGGTSAPKEASEEAVAIERPPKRKSKTPTRSPPQIASSIRPRQTWAQGRGGADEK